MNVLNAIKNIQEVCTSYCAMANPAEDVIAEFAQGAGDHGRDWRRTITRVLRESGELWQKGVVWENGERGEADNRVTRIEKIGVPLPHQVTLFRIVLINILFRT